MPMYEYRCEDCNQQFEVERSMKDDSQQHCVCCGSQKANRVWTTVVTLTSGSTRDYGQGTWNSSASTSKKSGCGSCTSKACGTCH